MLKFDTDLLLQFATFMLIYAGMLMATMIYLRSRREERRRHTEDQNETLESKLRLLAESSTRASSLAKQIDIEIEAMTNAANSAKDDAEKAQKIAALSKEEREAVADMVRNELGNELQGRGKREFWIQVGIGAIFFVLGIVASNLVPFLFQQ